MTLVSISATNKSVSIIFEIGPKMNLVRIYHAPPTKARTSKKLIRIVFKSPTVFFLGPFYCYTYASNL